MFYRSLILSFALLMLIGGCSENKAPDPPIARAELTARLYETLKFKRYSESLVIIDKLLALDSDDADLMEMRDRIIGNIATVKIQHYIDENRLEDGLKYIRSERRKFPVMPKLRLLEEELKNLIVLRKAAQTLAAADTISALTAALDFIVPLAAKYPAAKQLHNDIKQRKADLEKMRSDAAQAVEKAAANKPASQPAPAVKKP